jgi:hypothetical protein
LIVILNKGIKIHAIAGSKAAKWDFKIYLKQRAIAQVKIVSDRPTQSGQESYGSSNSTTQKHCSILFSFKQ